MSHFQKVVKKYNGVSLIIRILAGLVIGAVLALTVPGAKWIGELGNLFVNALKGIAPVLVFVIVAAALAQGTAKLDRRFGMVIWLYMLTTFIAAALAVCLAVPVFRVRGDYLAIVTLGFGFIIKILAINNPQITNGAIGLNDIPQQPHLLFWCGLFALLATGMILQLVWSKYGRMMKAIRDDEDAAIAMGVNTFRIKTCAFATSAFFEGIGGGLLASLLTTISPGLFDFMLTFQLLIIIVLGGLGSTTGALLGTVLVVGSGEWLRFLDQPLQFFGHDLGAYPGLRMVVFSLLLLIIMLFAREGLLGKKEIWQMGRRNSSYGGK